MEAVEFHSFRRKSSLPLPACASLVVLLIFQDVVVDETRSQRRNMPEKHGDSILVMKFPLQHWLDLSESREKVERYFLVPQPSVWGRLKKVHVPTARQNPPQLQRLNRRGKARGSLSSVVADCIENRVIASGFYVFRAGVGSCLILTLF